MKTITSVSWDTELVQALHAKRGTESLSAFTARLLTNALKLAPERTGPQLDKLEKAVMAGMAGLIERDADREPSHFMYNNKFFTLKEIVYQSGRYPSIALQGLRSLEQRGMLMSIMTPKLVDLHMKMDNPPEVEHWAKNPRYKGEVAP